MKKTVLIFGGSGAIGREITKCLLDKQMTVYATYHHNEEALKNLGLQNSQYSENLKAIGCDVTKHAQIKQVVERVIKEQGKIDALINCVGIMDQSLFIEKSLETWKTTIDTNVTSVFLACREVVPYMMEEQSGVILNFSSITGMYGMPGIVDYCAAKSAIIGFTKGLSAEIGRFGVRVNCISPGMLETEMTQESREKVGRGVKKMIPLKRFGNPADIAGVAAFLISDQASYITGENIVVGGGAGSALPIS